MSMRKLMLGVWVLALSVMAVAPVQAQGDAALPAGRVMLPQDHPYQKDLRRYLATLKEADFEVAEQPFTVAPDNRSAEDLYRAFILAAGIPPIHGIKQPAVQFTLASIEGDQAVMRPPVYVDALAWLVNWNDPGNPYYQSRAVKLRAFVAASVDMIMLDQMHETQPGARTTSSDCLGGTLIWLAQAYAAARDVLPADVREAYEAGLKKFVHRLDEWGPTGAMVDMDLFAAVSMRYVYDLIDDPNVRQIAHNYVQRLFTDARYFHPAGYFVDNSCFDTSYNGISLYFAGWAAFVAPDWPFVRQAVDQAFKLKSRLSFPDPDGNLFGPTQCSSRTSSDSPHDQWSFPPRNLGAAMLTDYALYLTPLPTPDALLGAPRKVTAQFNELLASVKPVAPSPWREDHWIASGAVNYAYDHYVKGHYDRRIKMQAEQSPLLKPPFARGDPFVETYDTAFLIARYADYGLAIHTGPVGDGLHGFGGGQLCGFWTPTTGTVILGRRRGDQAQVKGHFSAKEPGVSSIPDTFEAWRIWPIHAVSGITAQGNVFSSSRIRDCRPVYTVNGKRAEVRVSGLIPKDAANNGPCLQGDVRYSRSFVAGESGVRIETRIASDGKDSVIELYETIPVFLRESWLQASQRPAGIFFQTEKEWNEATTELKQGIRAVKIERFDGAVLITFAKPAWVKLSPEVWVDRYQTKATCRTILIDLLESGDKPVALTDEKTVSYTISAVAK